MKAESAKTPELDERWLTEAACGVSVDRFEESEAGHARRRGTKGWRDLDFGGGLPPTAWWHTSSRSKRGFNLNADNEAALKVCAGCGVIKQCAERTVEVPTGVWAIVAGKIVEAT